MRPPTHHRACQLDFATSHDRDSWTAAWKACAERVYGTEKNCLSYEMCNQLDSANVIIYER